MAGNNRIKLVFVIPAFLLMIGGTDLLSQSVPSRADTTTISEMMHFAENLASDSAVSVYTKIIALGTKAIEKEADKKVKYALQKKLIQAYLNLGLEYYHLLDYDKAQEQNLLALQLATTVGHPYFLGECHFNIAEVYLEQSRFSKALEEYSTAFDFYHKADDRTGEFWCYTGMGIVQKQCGNLKEAIRQYTNALNIAREAGMKNEEASCYNNLGNVYRRQGDFPKAMESYHLAIPVFKELKNEDAVSDCLNNIGNLYLDNGDPYRALDYYNQSLRIAQENNDEYRLIIRYKNLAGAYTELKDYDNAIQFLNDAIKLAEKSGDKSFLSSCNMQFGKLYAVKGDVQIAIAYYEKSVGLFGETGSRAEQAEARLELARVRYDAGFRDEAVEDAQQAEKIAGEVGLLKTQMEANQLLSKCFEKAGKPKIAYEHLVVANLLKDSLYNIDKYRTIEEIEAGFMQSEVKKENEILLQNNLLQQQAMRNKNILMILLGLSLVLSVAVIWLIYNRQKEARKETGLVKEISEQRIEKLSHDLTSKERELTAKTVFINQKNQLLEKLIADLESLKKNDVSPASVQHLQMQLRQELLPNAWKEFEIQFNDVHPGFQNRLIQQYPELTLAERRLCSFIRLDMNTREISSLTGQSIKSIEVARTRIRKKLNIPHEQNLTNAIALI